MLGVGVMYYHMLKAYRAVRVKAKHLGKKGSIAYKNQAGPEMGKCESRNSLTDIGIMRDLNKTLLWR